MVYRITYMLQNLLNAILSLPESKLVKKINANELRSRIYVGILIFIVFYYCITRGGYVLSLLFTIIALGVYHEFLNLIKSGNIYNIMNQRKWILCAILYTSIPFSILINISTLTNGNYLILWYFIVIWSTDCGAYFFGRLIKGRKLAPAISKGKTISGSIGGIATAIIIGYAFAEILPSFAIRQLGTLGILFLALAISILSQMSDLLESFIKRIFGVKDSGTILLGHGGIMDRMDSVTLSAPVFLIFIS